LKYSRWVDVRVVENEGVESLVRSLLSGFESFGGVPLVAVFDNPKTVVISRKDSRIQWNDTFGQTALDYRFAPELCTPRRGQEKGSAEHLVGYVMNGTFQVYRYSMPPEASGIPGMLLLYPERVRIVAVRFEREHVRVPEQGRDCIHPEDRAARLAQVSGKRGRLYLKRQEILDLGPAAE